MWFEPIDGSPAAASAWRLTESIVVHPWKAGRATVARLVRALRVPRDARPRATMSDEWLRQHEADAGKH